MSWISLALGAALSWGLYGASLHRGQTALGNPLKAMLCVGVAYFLIAVLVPVAALLQQGDLRNFNVTGTATATLAGALGALGAVCITYAFRNGGTPFIVMPLVFGGAPLINVLASMLLHTPKVAPNPMLYVGFLMAALGAGLVLYYRPPA
jgi:drug/metabolite transporter (DMT)-like permease